MDTVTNTNKLVYNLESADGDKVKAEIPYPKDSLDEAAILAQGQAIIDSGAFKPNGNALASISSCYKDVTTKTVMDPADYISSDGEEE